MAWPGTYHSLAMAVPKAKPHEDVQCMCPACNGYWAEQMMERVLEQTRRVLSPIMTDYLREWKTRPISSDRVRVEVEVSVPSIATTEVAGSITAGRVGD